MTHQEVMHDSHTLTDLHLAAWFYSFLHIEASRSASHWFCLRKGITWGLNFVRWRPNGVANGCLIQLGHALIVGRECKILLVEFFNSLKKIT